MHSTCRGSYADLSGPGVYLSRVMANTHTHTTDRPEARPITYGNGRARLTFLPRSILPTRPFPVALCLSFFLSPSLCLRPSVCLVPRSRSPSPSSNALIAPENRGLSQHERSVNPRPLVFSTFCLPLTRVSAPPSSLARRFLRYFWARVCLPAPRPLLSISFEIPPDQDRPAGSSITPRRARHPLISSNAG